MSHQYILVLFILSSIFYQNIIALPLNQNEVQSLQFLIQYYNLGWNLNEVECDKINSNEFELGCIDIGTESHIERLELTSNAQPLLSLSLNIIPSTLYFPYLKTFCGKKLLDPTITISPTILNLLDSTSNSNLENITIVESSLYSVPSPFPTKLPNLSTLKLPNCIIPNNNPSYLFNEMEFLLSSYPSYTFDSTSLPNLKKLSIQADSMPYSISINSPYISELSIQGSSQISLILQTPNIVSLDITNPVLSINQDLSVFKQLTKVYLNRLNLKITSAINLTDLFIQSSGVETFPLQKWFNGIVHNKLKLINTQLSGAIPEFNLTFNEFNIKDNPLVRGLVPSFICHAKTFSFINTSVESVPDCVKCYWNHVSSNFPSTVAQPNGFNCPIVLNATTYTSYDNATITIAGENLGWGIENDVTSGLQVLIPNKLFVYNIPSPNGSATLTFSESNGVSSPVYWSVNDNLTELTKPQIGIDVNQAGAGLSIKITGTNDLTVDTIQSITFNSKNCQIQSVDPTHNLLYSTIPNYVIGSGKYDLTVVTSSKTYTYKIKYNQQFPVVTSILPIYNNSKSFVIGGNFGDYQNVLVTIDKLNCNITFVNSSTIHCTVIGTLNTGKADLSVVVNGFTFSSKSLLYIDSNVDKCKTCKGNCNADGYCICPPGFGGLYCDQKLPTDSYGEFISSQHYPASSIKIGDTILQMKPYAIQELSLDRTVIGEISLLDSDWTATPINNNTNKFVYNNASSGGSASFDLEVILKYSGVDQEVVSFGGIQYQLAPRSVKQTIRITNYTYQFSVDTLRVLFQFQSIGGPTSITQWGVVDKNGLLYITRDVDGDPLGLEFQVSMIDRVISDGKPTFSNNEVVSRSSNTFTVGVNLPSCRNCEIDPDLSVLVKNDDPSRSSSTSDLSIKFSKQTWFIATITVSALVVFGALIIAGFLYSRRLKEARDIKRRVRSTLDQYYPSDKQKQQQQQQPEQQQNV